MSSNRAEETRISTRVAEEIRTPIGDVFVTYSPRSCEVSVSMFADRNRRVVCNVDESADEPTVRFVVGKRPPVVNDEITQNGRTFEVSGVRKKLDGGYQVKNDLGVWEDWQED